jgi:Raf kinase inhibitor-like YbhB/YbcL family protein
MAMKLSSPVFESGETIPDRYARKNGNVSPPLAWSGAPSQARGLALIVDDPDAPKGTFVHWLVYHIPMDVKSLDEGLDSHGELASGLRQGKNDFGGLGYGGPQPPSGTHHYRFHLFALDRDVDLPAGKSRQELESAMRGHIIEEAELVGLYGAR